MLNIKTSNDDVVRNQDVLLVPIANISHIKGIIINVDLYVCIC